MSGPSHFSALLKHLAPALHYADLSYKPVIGSNQHLSFLVKQTPRPSNITFIAFPGSHNSADWAVNANFAAVTATSIVSADSSQNVMVHKGFLQRFLQLLNGATNKEGHTLPQVLQRARQEESSVIFTGHSLGGAVASLATIWALHRQAA